MQYQNIDPDSKEPECPQMLDNQHNCSDSQSQPQPQCQSQHSSPVIYPINIQPHNCNQNYGPPLRTKDVSCSSASTSDEEECLIKQSVDTTATATICWSAEILLILIVFLSIIQAIQIFVLQYTSSSSGCFIMIINGYIAITLAALSVLLLAARWTWFIKINMPVFGLTLYIAIVVWGFTIIQATTIPILVYRQATEDFWVLFVSLPVYVQILLITTTIICATIVTMIVAMVLVKRFKYRKVISNNEIKVHHFAEPVGSKQCSKRSKKKKKGKRRKKKKRRHKKYALGLSTTKK